MGSSSQPSRRIPGWPDVENSQLGPTAARHSWKRSIIRDSSMTQWGVFLGTERTDGFYRAYGALLLYASDHDRIFAANSRSGEILVLNPEADTLDVWMTPFPSVPLLPAATTEDQKIHRFTGPSGEMTRVQVFDYPDAYPRLARLLPDTEGYLWVMEYPALAEPAISLRLASWYMSVVPETGARMGSAR